MTLTERPSHVGAPSRPPALLPTESSAVPSPAPGAPVGERITALEGLRGVAVAAVLAFHCGYSWARGGYLGVSVFFTLSGYLVTSLVLREHRETGRLSLRQFWARRARRLLPLAGLGVVGAAAVAGVVGADRGTRGDLLSALGQVANWRFTFSGASYGDLFAAPSPVLHYWSLAVEAQFYLLFPILAVVVLRRGRRALAWAVGGLCLASWASLAAAVAAGEVDFGYYSTSTRAAEILVGSLLALLWSPPPQRSRPAPASLTAGALVALAGLTWASATVATDPDGSHLLVLPFVTIASTLVVAAAVRGGPVAAMLSIRPLRALGTLSYAVYIIHWPVFVWLSPERTDLDRLPLTGLRLGVSLSLAAVAHLLVERPVLRMRRGPRGWMRTGIVAGGYAASLVAVLVLVGRMPVAPSMEEQAEDFARQLELPTVPDTSRPAPGVVEPPVAAVFGDSTSLVAGGGLKAWGAESGDLVVAGGVATLGCGIEPPGARRVGAEQRVEDRTEICTGALASWPQAITDSGATVAVILVGPWDVTDRRAPGSDEWTHVGQPGHDRMLLDLLGRTFDSLLAAGAEDVVWVSPAPMFLTRSPGNEDGTGPEADPARMERLNELAARAAATRPEVHLVDLSGYLLGLDPAEEERLRPDGVHFTEETSIEVARGWLGPEILSVVR